jgi:hypothetical protein
LIETKYKSSRELKYSLGQSNRIAVLSCGACANLCDVGGVRGMKYLKGLIEEWGKTVVFAKTLPACCPEPIMRQTQKNALASSNLDAFVIISCAAGVKSAFICGPDIPIIAACDSIGASPIVSGDTSKDDLVANTLCSSCGHCVISYTGGVCPLFSCSAKSLYGPCKKAPVEGMQCALNPQRVCIWREIEGRGADLEGLQELKRIRGADLQTRIPSLSPKSSPTYIRGFIGNVGTWIPGRLLEMVHWIR